MIFAAILAGGVGSRMNIESMPKQFLPLGSKPIFIHTLNKFQLTPGIDAIFIGVHKDWIDFAREAIRDEIVGNIPVYVVAGGSDRNATIMSIIESIEQEFGICDDSAIVTHDSVRPFVKISTIESNIRKLDRFDACDTVVPATDTIVESMDGTAITSIPVRANMYQGQTPQSFKIGALKRIYNTMSEKDIEQLTDACKMFVLAGVPVGLVEGDPANIKLTTIADYKVAQAMLAAGLE